MTTPEDTLATPAAQGADLYAQTVQPSNGMATASLVLGIVSLAAVLIPLLGLISWVCAPLGLIFGFIGVGRPTGRGMAIAGLICSALALFIALLWAMIFGFIIMAAAAGGGL